VIRFTLWSLYFQGKSPLCWLERARPALRWLYCSGFWPHVHSSVDASISEKHTVSAFKTEMAMLGSGGICVGLEDGKADRVAQRKFRKRKNDYVGCCNYRTTYYSVLWCTVARFGRIFIGHCHVVKRIGDTASVKCASVK
jgi:hypothetical protein